MLLRTSLRDPNRILKAGCFALIVANVAQYFFRRTSLFPESIADPLGGFLFGVAITTLLLSIVVRQRRNGGSSQRPGGLGHR